MCANLKSAHTRICDILNCEMRPFRTTFEGQDRCCPLCLTVAGAWYCVKGLHMGHHVLVMEDI